MAQRNTINLTDRAATPLAHAFTPRGNGANGDSAVFAESATVPMGERKLIVRNRRSGKKTIISLTLINPTLVTETVNGVPVPTVPRTAYAEVVIKFDDTSSLQERKDTVGMLATALAANQTVLDATLTGLEQIW